MGDMALSIRPDFGSLLAQLGEQAGDISVQCSDTGGIVGRLNRVGTWQRFREDAKRFWW